MDTMIVKDVGGLPQGGLSHGCRDVWRRRLLRPVVALAAAVGVAVTGMVATPPPLVPESQAASIVAPPGPSKWYPGTAVAGRWPGNYRSGDQFAYCALQDSMPGPSYGGTPYGGAYDITSSGASGRVLVNGRNQNAYIGAGIPAKKIGYVLSKYGRTSDRGESGAVKVAMYKLEGIWSEGSYWYHKVSAAVRNRADQMVADASQWATRDFTMSVPTVKGATRVGEKGIVGNIGVKTTPPEEWYPGGFPIHLEITSNNAVFDATGNNTDQVPAFGTEAFRGITRTGEGKIEITAKTDDNVVPLARLYRLDTSRGNQPLFWAPSQTLKTKTPAKGKPTPPTPSEIEFRTRVSSQVVSPGGSISDTVEAFLKPGENGEKGAWPTYAAEEPDPKNPSQTITVTRPLPVRAQVTLFGPFTQEITQGPASKRPEQYKRQTYTVEFTSEGSKVVGPYSPKTAGFYTWTVDATMAMQDGEKVAKSNLKNLDFHSPFGEAVETAVMKFRPVAKSSVQHSLTSQRDPKITGIEWDTNDDYVDQPRYSCPEPTPGADNGRECPPYPTFRFYKNEKEDHENVAIDQIYAYAENGSWLKDASGEYVPVKYTGRLYYSNTMIHDQGTSFDGLDLVATRTITATGPGTYKVRYADRVQMKRHGFYTWVWSVEADQPGPHADWIETGWRDQNFVYTESTYMRFTPNVDSEVKERNVNRNGRSIDRVTISHIVSDHGQFKGVGNVDGLPGTFWKADNMDLHLTLYGPYEELPGASFRYKLTTNPANNTQPRVCTITVPMKNGKVGERTLPSGQKVWGVGWSNDQPGQEGEKGFLDKECITEKPGYYRWVASFEGDDRVAPYISPTDDIYEWITVDRVEPTMWTQADHRVEKGQPMRDTVHVVGQPKDSWKENSRFVFDVYGPYKAGQVPAAVPEKLYKRVPAREKYAGVGAYPSRDIVPTENGYYYWKARLIQGGKQCFENLDGEATSPGSVAPETGRKGQVKLRVVHPQAGKPAVGMTLEVRASLKGAVPEKTVLRTKITGPDGKDTGMDTVENLPEKGVFSIGGFTPTTEGEYTAITELVAPDNTVLDKETFKFDVQAGELTIPVGNIRIQAGLGLPDDFDPEIGDQVQAYANILGEGEAKNLFVKFQARSDKGGKLESELIEVTKVPSTITGPKWSIDTKGDWTVTAVLVDRGEKDKAGKYPDEVVVDEALDWWGLHFKVGRDIDLDLTTPTDPASKNTYPPAGCLTLWESSVGESGENTWVHSPGTPPVTPPSTPPSTPPTTPPGTPPPTPGTPELKVRTQVQAHRTDPATLGKIRDKLYITGTVPKGAYAKVELFYQPSRDGGLVCTTPVWTSNKVTLTPGQTEAYTEEYTPEKPGVYHFREAVYSEDGKLITQGKCGVEEETIVVAPPHPSLKVTTIAKHEKPTQKTDKFGSLYDTLKVEGTVPKGAYAKVELFYQPSRDGGLVCGTPVWTSNMIPLTNGAGEYVSEKYLVPISGVYHFREAVYSEDGKLIAQGKCGVEEETITVKPSDDSGDGSGQNLAKTGTTAATVAPLAALMLMVGAGLTVLARRRHTTPYNNTWD